MVLLHLPAARVPGGLLLPVLVFFFLPLTTIVYAWELNSGMPTAGINLLWLLIAVIIDLGGLGGGAHRRSRRWQTLAFSPTYSARFLDALKASKPRRSFIEESLVYSRLTDTVRGEALEG